MKLAALIAVGVNYMNPCVDACAAKWAIDLVKSDAHNLIKRFEDGTACVVEDTVSKAEIAIRRAVRKFVTSTTEEILKSRGEREANFHSEHILPFRFIQQHIYRKIKSVDLHSGIKNLIDSGELIEIDNKLRDKLQKKYGIECFKAKLYAVDASLFDRGAGV